MARFFDVLTDNLSGVNQEVSYKEKREEKSENYRNLLISSTFHSPVDSPFESAVLPADLSYSSDGFDLLALSPTKQTASFARRLLSSKSTLSTLISQPFQYSYWLLMGLFLTACSNSGGPREALPADPASVEPPFGNIDIKYGGGVRSFSKEFNDAYLEDVKNPGEDDPAPVASTNVELPVEFTSDQAIDFAASLRYLVTLTDKSGEKKELDYTHADAVGEDGNASAIVPFFAIIETESSGFLVANHRYDFDSDRGEIYNITLVAVTDSGEIYDSLEVEITGLDEADDAPTFIDADDEFKFSFEENVSKIDEIATIRAFPDVYTHKITYSLDQDSEELGFHIDPKTGVLSYEDIDDLALGNFIQATD